jgi:hypothetical protein
MSDICFHYSYNIGMFRSTYLTCAFFPSGPSSQLRNKQNIFSYEAPGPQDGSIFGPCDEVCDISMLACYTSDV